MRQECWREYSCFLRSQILSWFKGMCFFMWQIGCLSVPWSNGEGFPCSYYFSPKFEIWATTWWRKEKMEVGRVNKRSTEISSVPWGKKKSKFYQEGWALEKKFGSRWYMTGWRESVLFLEPGRKTIKEGCSNNYFAGKNGLCISLLLCNCLLLLPQVSSFSGYIYIQHSNHVWSWLIIIINSTFTVLPSSYDSLE